MTKNINNNEIETIEGTYVENIEYDNQYNEQPKKTKRNFLKPLIIGALAVVVTGGVGAYAYDKYETAQRTKIQDAYSNIKLNTGNQTDSNNNGNNNNTQQNAKSQQEIRSIVADAISVPEQNINFVKIKPKYEDDYAPQNNGVSLYVYKVEAKANGLEYDVVVDAVSGKVLKVKIDD
ncbi:MAG: PepSY domain-containing protein [Gemella haemolysans]|uniref:PepSY domain-containing protein n=1 Tax=Gemella haemolysans TaxID=1379 RepID=UPI00290F367B|nr:PepSY domain-containing protein [Gemella haemolysans]MDU6573906.1 PepSY domain-containing protein [Gemella haemolysans]